MKKISFSFIFIFVFALTAHADDKPFGKIWFIKPKEGEKVKNPVTFCLGAENLKVVKWGKKNVEGEGHHHLVIDVDLEKAKDLKVLRKSVRIVHQSSGASCHTLKIPLKEGKHTISGMFTHNNHKPYKPVISAAIHIEALPSKQADKKEEIINQYSY